MPLEVAIDPKPENPTGTQRDPPSAEISREAQLAKMRSDWDRRAAENAMFYVSTGREQWSEEEFYTSGEETFGGYILNDTTNICQGRNPRDMTVLEIGCGAGRVTRAMARYFGEVHAVDVSGVMAGLARKAVAQFPNAFVYQNDGMGLSVIPSGKQFDFAFSHLVFQHIPSQEIIRNYVRDVYSLLRPGALFKFQVQGNSKIEAKPDDTWVGIPFSEQEIVRMAAECGFEARHRVGTDEQDFWNWFFKPAA